jgi:hypothetical protein
MFCVLDLSLLRSLSRSRQIKKPALAEFKKKFVLVALA